MSPSHLIFLARQSLHAARLLGLILVSGRASALEVVAGEETVDIVQLARAGDESGSGTWVF